MKVAGSCAWLSAGLALATWVGWRGVPALLGLDASAQSVEAGPTAFAAIMLYWVAGPILTVVWAKSCAKGAVGSRLQIRVRLVAILSGELVLVHFVLVNLRLMFVI
jgi:hypothetical protein